MQQHQNFFEFYTKQKPQNFIKLPQSGSSRINYIATSDSQKYVVTYNNNVRENEAFFYFSNLFSDLKLNTPKIVFINKDRDLYIQEFLGDQTLSEIISAEGFSERVKILTQKTLKSLFEIQTKTLGKVDFKKSFEYQNYDNLTITHDLFYFKNFLIDVLEIEYYKSSLLKEFKNISDYIQNLKPNVLMMRDFQSRNILVKDDEVFFIDYQSAMKGIAAYDVISFLYQAKANFPEDFKIEMLDYYESFWREEKDKQALKESYNWIIMIRYLQVLGAYAFRGLIQRKAHFLDSLFIGIDNIYQFSQSWEEISGSYPELFNLIQELKSESVQLKIKNLILNKIG